MNIPSYSALLNKDKQIKAIQELYENVNELEASENALLTNSIPEDQKKQFALNAVASLMVMYGYTSTTSENPEWETVILDSEDRIIMGKKVDGTLVIFGEEYSS